MSCFIRGQQCCLSQCLFALLRILRINSKSQMLCEVLNVYISNMYVIIEVCLAHPHNLCLLIENPLSSKVNEIGHCFHFFELKEIVLIQ